MKQDDVRQGPQDLTGLIRRRPLRLAPSRRVEQAGPRVPFRRSALPCITSSVAVVIKVTCYGKY